MTRSELINRLASRFPQLTIADTEASVHVILGAISAALVSRNRAEIRGFGSFSLNERPARVGRNPKTGARVDVPAKQSPHFKPGLELRNRVDFPK